MNVTCLVTLSLILIRGKVIYQPKLILRFVQGWVRKVVHLAYKNRHWLCLYRCIESPSDCHCFQRWGKTAAATNYVLLGDVKNTCNLVNITNLVHNFLNMFIAFRYMFRATMCPSSGEITVSMRLGICHSIWMTVWYAGRNEFRPAYQTVIHIEWQIPGVA